MDKKDNEKKEKKNNIGILLNCYTYNSMHSGLFSFKNISSKDISNKTLFLKEDHYIFRIGNEINAKTEHFSEQPKTNEEEYICKVVNNMKFKLRRPFSPDFGRIKNNFYYVINSYENKKEEQFDIKNEDCYLVEGDIIKLSVHLFLIRKIYIQNKKELDEKDEKNIYDIHFLDPNNKVSKINTCYDPNILNEENYCIHIVNDLKEGKNSKNLMILKEI